MAQGVRGGGGGKVVGADEWHSAQCASIIRLLQVHLTLRLALPTPWRTQCPLSEATKAHVTQALNAHDSSGHPPYSQHIPPLPQLAPSIPHLTLRLSLPRLPSRTCRWRAGSSALPCSLARAALTWARASREGRGGMRRSTLQMGQRG